MNIYWERKRGEPSPLDRVIGHTHPNALLQRLIDADAEKED